MMDDYIKRADAVNAVCELALIEEEAEEFADNPSVGVADTSLCTREAFEEAEHRAEVFERMAFKLGEELDAAKKYIEKNNYIKTCGACLYKDEDSNGKHCKDCTVRNSHFIFSAEKAREEE